MPGLWSWLPWSPYSRLNARWNGRRDGQKGIPPLDQVEHAPYEMQLKQVGEENIKRVAQRWGALDQKLKAEYCSAKAASIAAGNRDLPDAEGMHIQASRENDEAREALRTSLGNVDLGPVAYGLIMVIVAIGEFPLNALVFRLFGEAEVLTYVMSTALAVVLPFSAHCLGILAKRRPFKDGLFRADAVLTLLATLVPVAAILGIGYFREQYVEALDVQKLLGIRMDPAKVTLVFIAINMLIFLAATLASYLAHDPAVRKAKKALRAAARRLREFQGGLTRAQAASDEAVSRLQKAGAERQALWEKKRSEATEIKDVVQRLIEVYRTHNLRVRGSPAMPRSFISYPLVKIPGVLEELDWGCPGLEATGMGDQGKPQGRASGEDAG